MKICIIGGRLQGTEACYLARACGMYSILIDIDPEVPASGLADRFAAGDLIKEDPKVMEAFRRCRGRFEELMGETQETVGEDE